MTMSFHTCSGVECPQCGVFAQTAVSQPTRRIIRCDLCQSTMLPGIRTCFTCGQRVCRACAPHVPSDRYLCAAQVMCGLCFTSQQRVGTFVDSRGRDVARMPECLYPSATVIIVAGQPWRKCLPWDIVVHQRRDNAQWGLIGGRQEIGESILHCAAREAFEETGLIIAVAGLVCIDSDPAHFALCAYPDGHVVHYTNCTFIARVTSGTLRISEESLALTWASTDDLPEPFLPGHRQRLTYAMNYQGPYIPVE